MQLWNDYEGKTIAEVYSLGELLRPEGRSALFALPKGAGAPAIIRLTEALNDESQMLACWRRVAEVKQENLVRIKNFGQTTFEGTPLTYAIMERTDANLADLLQDRPLTHPEAMQVATSVTAALAALHARGFVHEHVSAANILAAGETVKLRTDCVRECIIDVDHTSPAEWEELIQRDVQDLARLLLYALTLEKKLTPATRLPAPFDKIIPNGLNGSWGLAEFSAALNPVPPTPLVPESVLKPAGTTSQPRSAAPSTPTRNRTGMDDLMSRHRRRVEDTIMPSTKNIRLWAAIAAVVIILLALALDLSKTKPTPPTQATTPHITTSQPTPIAPAPQPPIAAPQPTLTPEVQATLDSKPAVAAHMQAGWYVIAYTYNREDQAWKRAGEIMKRQPALHPEVIAPTGHAPYLLSLGGAMSRDEATAVRNRARHSGMPHDTFIRNYRAN